MAAIAVRDNDIGVKMLVWHRDNWTTPDQAREIVCAVGVDAKQARFVLGLLEADPFERDDYANKLKNCLDDLKERSKIDPNCHIRCKNIVTGEYMNVYFRLAVWLTHALRCRDEFRLACARGDIRKFLYGDADGMIINRRKL